MENKGTSYPFECPFTVYPQFLRCRPERGQNLTPIDLPYDTCDFQTKATPLEDDSTCITEAYLLRFALSLAHTNTTNLVQFKALRKKTAKLQHRLRVAYLAGKQPKHTRQMFQPYLLRRRWLSMKSRQLACLSRTTKQAHTR